MGIVRGEIVVRIARRLARKPPEYTKTCRSVPLRALVSEVRHARWREVVSAPAAYGPAMIEIPRSAPASVACGRRGLPLLATCPCDRRRLVPFRLLKTDDGDTTPLPDRQDARGAGGPVVHPGWSRVISPPVSAKI